MLDILSERMNSDKQYNKLLQEVQQQFLSHRERTNTRLGMIEELTSLAVQKLNTQTQGLNEEFVNPFGLEAEDVPRRTYHQDSLKHLKLSYPRYEKDKIVEDWIQDCELYFEIYGVPENKKVTIAGMHLEGVYKSWYQTVAMGRICLG